MSKFKIHTGNTNPILRSLSTPVAIYELKKYTSLAEEMIKYIRNPDNRGVGLAAPQVGVNKRIIVVSLMKTYEDEQFRTIVMFNPEILEHSQEKSRDKEGCLSVPGESGSVERWNWIKVRFLDSHGHKCTLKLEGLSARIVQHEMDHLDGILFIDKVENVSLASKI